VLAAVWQATCRAGSPPGNGSVRRAVPSKVNHPEVLAVEKGTSSPDQSLHGHRHHFTQTYVYQHLPPPPGPIGIGVLQGLVAHSLRHDG
jgi:hypothetical protein